MGRTVGTDGRGDRMAPRHLELGRRGEEAAVAFLHERGMRVLARNWRCREGELDIVAMDWTKRLHFCEVKTRSGVGYGSGAESVTIAKRRRIRRLAQLWLSEFTQGWHELQFDVISVLWREGTEPELTYLPGAF